MFRRSIGSTDRYRRTADVESVVVRIHQQQNTSYKIGEGHVGPWRDMYSTLSGLGRGRSCCGVEIQDSLPRMSHALSARRSVGTALPEEPFRRKSVIRRVSTVEPGMKFRQGMIWSVRVTLRTTTSVGALTTSGGTWPIGAEGFALHAPTH